MKDEEKYSDHINSGDIVECVCGICGNVVAFIPNPHIPEEKLIGLLHLVVERNKELINAPCNNPDWPEKT